MKHFALALAMTASLATSATAASFGPLVEAAELSASLDTVEPVLLDIRNEGYEKGHADGALFAPYRMFRGPAENPGGLDDESNLRQCPAPFVPHRCRTKIIEKPDKKLLNC